MARVPDGLNGGPQRGVWDAFLHRYREYSLLQQRLVAVGLAVFLPVSYTHLTLPTKA